MAVAKSEVLKYQLLDKIAKKFSTVMPSRSRNSTIAEHCIIILNVTKNIVLLKQCTNTVTRVCVKLSIGNSKNTGSV